MVVLEKSSPFFSNIPATTLLQPLLITLAALLLAPLAALSATESKLRNIVLILADDMGNDMSGLGTPGLATPNLDQLARDGVLFTRAFSAAAVCSPSRAAILTGMFPHSNGLWCNTQNAGLDYPRIADKPERPSPVRSAIREDIPTLVELLKERGFYSAITQKSHIQPAWRFPFDKGFPYRNKPGEYKRLVGEVKNAAGERPFFLMANISSPHRPFKGHLAANGLGYEPATIDPEKISVPSWLPDTPLMRKDLAQYYACVQITDACVGAVLAGLKEQGLLENTLVIFTSDNGFGYPRGKTSGYAAGLHMPLLVAGPGVRRNERCAVPVSLVDIMPTMLSAVGLPVPETVQGLPLWPLLKGQAKDFPRNVMMASESEHYLARAVCDGRYYYVRNVVKPSGGFKRPPMNADLYDEKVWDNRAYRATLEAQKEHPVEYGMLADFVDGHIPDEELFDLKSDPYCMKNVLSDPALTATLETLRASLVDWRKRTDDRDTQEDLRLKFPKPLGNVGKE